MHSQASLDVSYERLKELVIAYQEQLRIVENEHRHAIVTMDTTIIEPLRNLYDKLFNENRTKDEEIIALKKKLEETEAEKQAILQQKDEVERRLSAQVASLEQRISQLTRAISATHNPASINQIDTALHSNNTAMSNPQNLNQSNPQQPANLEQSAQFLLNTLLEQISRSTDPSYHSDNSSLPQRKR